MLCTAIEFIDTKGGPAEIAKAFAALPSPAIRHTAGAVALWRHRNKLPRAAWPEIVEAFPDVSLEKLKEIERTALERV